MVEIIFDYLNTGYYLDIDNNSAHYKSGGEQIGFSQIESLIIRIFGLSEDYAYSIVFNWLLINGIELIKKNWNATYMTDSNGYTISTTDDVNFEYKLIPHA